MSLEDEMKEKIGKEVAHHTSKKIGKIVGIVGATIAGIFFILLFGFLLGWAVQWLWNNTLAVIFDWPTISYWEAVGLFVLAKLFFGFGHSGGHGKHRRKKRGDEGDRKVQDWWKRRMGDDDSVAPTTDESFKAYWQEEGKAAFEKYMASRKSGRSNDPQ